MMNNYVMTFYATDGYFGVDVASGLVLKANNLKDAMKIAYVIDKSLYSPWFSIVAILSDTPHFELTCKFNDVTPKIQGYYEFIPIADKPFFYDDVEITEKMFWEMYCKDNCSERRSFEKISYGVKEICCPNCSKCYHGDNETGERVAECGFSLSSDG